MKHCKRLGVAAALVMTTFGVAGSAQATQLTPTGAERTFSSTNALFSVHNGGTFRCSSTMTGTLPATSSTWVAVPITSLTYSMCIANGTLPVTVDVNCSPTLHTMGIGTNQAAWTLTLPAGCTISATVPSIGCAYTINGPQTIGNGTTGFGGGVLTGGATPTIHLNNSIVRDIGVDGPTTASCAFSASHTVSGTLTGTYTGNGTVDVDGS